MVISRKPAQPTPREKVDARTAQDSWDLIDGAGEAISQVIASYEDGDFILSEIPESRGRLKAYFFHDGKRYAALTVGDLVIPGNLATRWQNGRRIWMLRLVVRDDD